MPALGTSVFLHLLPSIHAPLPWGQHTYRSHVYALGEHAVLRFRDWPKNTASVGISGDLGPWELLVGSREADHSVYWNANWE